MQINNKFNIGDTVYYLGNRSIVEAKIFRIVTMIDCKKDIHIFYSTGYGSEDIGENSLFKSKEDLKNSL